MPIVMALIPVIAVSVAGIVVWCFGHLAKRRCKEAGDGLDEDLQGILRNLKKVDEKFIARILSVGDVDAAFSDFAKARTEHYASQSDTPWLFDSDDLKKKFARDRVEQVQAIHGRSRTMALVTCATLFILVLVGEAILYSQAAARPGASVFSPKATQP